MRNAIQEKTPEHALAQWRHLYAAELDAVNDTILSLTAETKAPLIAEMARYIVHSGGKRLRPVLTILSAKLFGYTDNRHIRLAAAIEFIHTATLLHDDVVDGSDLRRGEETANNRFGNAPSVLVGDFLLSRAFQLMAQDGNIEVLQTLADASAVISEGEVKQLMAAGDITTDQQHYIDIIRSKTATLFAAACKVGALVAGRTAEEAESMRIFGEQLGIAFQIVDDVLDYSAAQERLGKEIGDDFREGKVTLPVILAYQAGDAKEQAFWQRVIEQPEGQTEEDFTRAMALVHSHGALATAITEAESYAAHATAALNTAPDNDIKTALLDLLEFSVNRQF